MPEKEKKRIKDLCFLDTETTGLNPEYHVITEIYAKRIDTVTFKTKGEYGAKIYVNDIDLNNADEIAMNINGYDKKIWSTESLLWGTVFNEILPLIDNTMIVGSNPSFDINMVCAMNEKFCRNASKNNPNSHGSLDLASLGFPIKLFNETQSSSLGVLVKYFNIDLGEEFKLHTSKGDVYNSIEVYKKLIEMNSGFNFEQVISSLFMLHDNKE